MLVGLMLSLFSWYFSHTYFSLYFTYRKEKVILSTMHVAKKTIRPVNHRLFSFFFLVHTFYIQLNLTTFYFTGILEKIEEEVTNFLPLKLWEWFYTTHIQAYYSQSQLHSLFFSKRYKPSWSGGEEQLFYLHLFLCSVVKNIVQ